MALPNQSNIPFPNPAGGDQRPPSAALKLLVFWSFKMWCHIDCYKKLPKFRKMNFRTTSVSLVKQITVISTWQPSISSSISTKQIENLTFQNCRIIWKGHSAFALLSALFWDHMENFWFTMNARTSSWAIGLSMLSSSRMKLSIILWSHSGLFIVFKECHSC